MPLNLSPLCNFLPKKFNTLKTYFYKVSVPFLVHYCTCYINKLSDRLFNSLAWRKKGTREIPIVLLKLSFKDCPYLQVHQLKSFQIQIQLVHNKIEGVSITMKKLKSHLQRNVVLLQRNFVLEF